MLQRATIVASVNSDSIAPFRAIDAMNPAKKPLRATSAEHVNEIETSGLIFLSLWGQNSSVIYLDHNATTPVLPEVLEAMMPYLTTEWGNPSSAYKFGAKVKSVIETAREQVAELIGGRSRAR